MEITADWADGKKNGKRGAAKIYCPSFHCPFFSWSLPSAVRLMAFDGRQLLILISCPFHTGCTRRLPESPNGRGRKTPRAFPSAWLWNTTPHWSLTSDQNHWGTSTCIDWAQQREVQALKCSSVKISICDKRYVLVNTRRHSLDALENLPRDHLVGKKEQQCNCTMCSDVKYSESTGMQANSKMICFQNVIHFYVTAAQQYDRNSATSGNCNFCKKWITLKKICLGCFSSPRILVILEFKCGKENKKGTKINSQIP